VDAINTDARFHTFATSRCRTGHEDQSPRRLGATR
jgi:hypothetical protein